MTDVETERAQPVIVDSTSWTGDIGPSSQDEREALGTISPQQRRRIRADGVRDQAQRILLIRLLWMTSALVLLDLAGAIALLVSVPASYALHGIIPAAGRAALAILMLSPLPLIVERLWKYETRSSAELDAKREQCWQFIWSRVNRSNPADPPPSAGSLDV